MYFGALMVPVAILSASFGLGCTPSAQSVPCANDGQCEKASAKYHYCVAGACVECVGDMECGNGTCTAGRCQAPCKEGNDCSGAHARKDGTSNDG